MPDETNSIETQADAWWAYLSDKGELGLIHVWEDWDNLLADDEVPAGCVPFDGDALRWSCVEGRPCGWVVVDGAFYTDYSDPATFAEALLPGLTAAMDAGKAARIDADSAEALAYLGPRWVTAAQEIVASIPATADMDDPAAVLPMELRATLDPDSRRTFDAGSVPARAVTTADGHELAVSVTRFYDEPMARQPADGNLYVAISPASGNPSELAYEVGDTPWATVHTVYSCGLNTFDADELAHDVPHFFNTLDDAVDALAEVLPVRPIDDARHIVERALCGHDGTGAVLDRPATAILPDGNEITVKPQCHWVESLDYASPAPGLSKWVVPEDEWGNECEYDSVLARSGGGPVESGCERACSDAMATVAEWVSGHTLAEINQQARLYCHGPERTRSL
jgi:hypothetical protein